ncbi:MAG: endonuclease/exonuclease/phosphatase family metal-dependent hydrolase [Candidatus Poriferisodalaceae bacterium]|jgi:endonuclease/exonuclease/phosphatase family metal-dependent hydrolase
MRVVTWNLWWRFGPWEARQAAIAQSLVAMNPDIVCLQEVWADENATDQAHILAGALGGFYVARTPQRFFEGVSFGNAILSRWPILGTEVLDLAPIRDGWGHRKVLHALVDAPHANVPVFCTHLAYRFDESALRQEQVTAVLKFIDRHRGDHETGHPPVLGADLNAVPTSDEIRLFTGESPAPVPGLVMVDAWPQRGDGPGVTWTRDNPHSADASWPERRIDYVMTGWPRPKPLGNVIACHLAGIEPIDGVQPSDHYALVVDLHEGPIQAG